METPSILVIDQNLFFRQLFADLLEREGFLVEFAESESAAVERVRVGAFDLVLVDADAADLDVRSFLHACRTLDRGPEVILVAAQSGRDAAVEGLKYGAFDYLVKPFPVEELQHRIGGALEARRLARENETLGCQVQWLQEAASLAGILERDRLLSQAVTLCLRQTGGTMGFAVVREAADEMTLHGLSGFAAEEVRTWAPRLFSFISPGDDLSWLSLETTRQFGLDEGLWVFPLRAQGVVRGFVVFTVGPSGFSRQKLQFLCTQIASGFDNAWRFEQAQELMYTDDLTGLYNHRYLQVALDQELKRSGRYGLEFALVFVDLDYFKEVNDRYGHLVGSAILRETARLLEQCVRDADILFRYGGDEFTALLVETEDRGAEVVAERIRRTLADHRFLVDEGLDVQVTATIGYAIFPTDSEERLDLLNQADRAMYWGKKQRNVVRCIRDIPSS